MWDSLLRLFSPIEMPSPTQHTIHISNSRRPLWDCYRRGVIQTCVSLKVPLGWLYPSPYDACNFHSAVCSCSPELPQLHETKLNPGSLCSPGRKSAFHETAIIRSTTLIRRQELREANKPAFQSNFWLAIRKPHARLRSRPTTGGLTVIV